MYPALGWFAGHGYPTGPSFGAPCPVTLFFFGMMLFVRGPMPVALLVIPVAWAVIGTSAAVALGIREDVGLAVGAVLVLVAAVSARSARRQTDGNALPAPSR